MKETKPDCSLFSPFLFPFHPSWRQYYEDGILVQEMVDQGPANFIVIPLLLLRPSLAFRIVQLRHHFQTPLVWVVPQPIFQQWLVVVEPFDGELRSARVFFEQLFGEISWFILFLNKAENLIHFIWHNISVLVDLIFGGLLLYFLFFREIVVVRRSQLYFFRLSFWVW